MNEAPLAIRYTLFSETGEILDSNEDKAPLRYQPGKGVFPPFVEEALSGICRGEERKVLVPPEKGFGEHKASLVKKTDRQNLPTQWQQVGTLVELVDDTGHERRARVVEVDDVSVCLDFNHPFAGKKLIFSIKVEQ